VDAPREIAVHRKEVYERIQEANRRASQASQRNLKEMSELWRTRQDGGSPF
jgi:carbon storage regulator CsrA